MRFRDNPANVRKDDTFSSISFPIGMEPNRADRAGSLKQIVYELIALRDNFSRYDDNPSSLPIISNASLVIWEKTEKMYFNH